MNFTEFARACGYELLPFQKRIFRAVSGPESVCVVLIARDNAKSTLVALIGLYWLYTRSENVYAVANSRDQAHTVLTYAKRFARELDDPHVIERSHDIRFCKDPSKPAVIEREFKALPADAKTIHGLKGRFIYDELHMATSDEVWIAGRSSSERANTKLLVVSTAAPSNGSVLGELRNKALEGKDVTRRGCLTSASNGNIRLLAWEADPDAPIDDMRVAKMCNPAPWITRASLRRLKDDEPDHAFRRFHRNEHATAGEATWVAPSLWQACRSNYTIEPGEEIWIGVDVGGTRALSSVCWVTDDLRVGVKSWRGEESVLFAQAEVERLAGEFKVVECAYDPWHFAPAALDLGQRGLRMVEFKQSNQRMVPASDRLKAAVTEGRLKHPGDPLLDRAAAQAVAKLVPPAGWRIDRSVRTDDIDPLTALCIAVDRAEAPKPEPAQFLGWL
ncbi:MAG TPA: terminase TerL endonuclease subunit [Thermoleophilaceae bacterium]